MPEVYYEVTEDLVRIKVGGLNHTTKKEVMEFRRTKVIPFTIEITTDDDSFEGVFRRVYAEEFVQWFKDKGFSNGKPEVSVEKVGCP